MIGNCKRTPLGFTLMEMMVVTALFALTVTLSSVMFIRTTREGTRAKNIQTVQGDLRYVMEKIGQDLQTATIDYEYYRKLGSAKDANKSEPWRDEVTNRILLDRTGSRSGQLIDRIGILALRDGFYNQIFYVWNAGAQMIETCTNTLGGGGNIDPAYCDQADRWERLTPSRSQLQKVEFIVSPSSDPFFQPLTANDCLLPLTWNDGIGRCNCKNGGVPDATKCWIGEVCEQTTTPGGTDFFCQAPDEQPSVTFIVEGISIEIGSDSETDEGVRLQSTITSRRYQR